MAILGGGSEMWACVPSDSTVTETTETGTFNSAWSRCCVATDKSTSYAEWTPTATMTSEAWFSVVMAVRGGGSGSTAHQRIVWLDDSDVERVRVTHVYSTGTLTLQYDVGAGWVTAGSAITIALEKPNLQTIVIRGVINNASGSLTLFVGGTERISSGTIDLSAITELNKVRTYGASISGLGAGGYYSQVIFGSESLIGMVGNSGYPSSNGANTAWTGDYTQVDEAVTADSDFIFSATNGQRETYAMTYVGSMTGYTGRALVYGARAKRGSSGPANLQLTTVSGSTTTDTSSISLGLGYTANIAVAETDPDTSTAWTSSGITSAQVGVEANT